MKPFLENWKRRADELEIQVYAIYLAYQDPRVPLYARIFAACVVGYALSPIDLIPDFIPVLGYLDDLIIVPLGVALALKMIPANVMADCQAQSRDMLKPDKPMNQVMIVIIISIWLLLAGIIVYVLFKLVTNWGESFYI